MQMTMTVKGQVTIPKALRDAAGIRPGMIVDVRAGAPSEVVVSPVRADPEEQSRRRAEINRILDEVSGTIDLGMTTDEFMAMIREPVPL